MCADTESCTGCCMPCSTPHTQHQEQCRRSQARCCSYLYISFIYFTGREGSTGKGRQPPRRGGDDDDFEPPAGGADVGFERGAGSPAAADSSSEADEGDESDLDVQMEAKKAKA